MSLDAVKLNDFQNGHENSKNPSQWWAKANSCFTRRLKRHIGAEKFSALLRATQGATCRLPFQYLILSVQLEVANGRRKRIELKWKK